MYIDRAEVMEQAYEMWRLLEQPEVPPPAPCTCLLQVLKHYLNQWSGIIVR